MKIANLLMILVFVCCVGISAQAGTFTTSPWADDTDLPFKSCQSYTHAIDLANADSSFEINGVTVTQKQVADSPIIGTDLVAGNNYTITAAGGVFWTTNGGLASSGVTGPASTELAKGMISYWGGAFPITIELEGLEPNTDYTFIYFKTIWAKDSNKEGRKVVLDGSDDGEGNAETFEQDATVTSPEIIEYSYNTGDSTTFTMSLDYVLNNSYPQVYSFANRLGSAALEAAQNPSPKNCDQVVAQNPLTLSWTNLDPNNPNDSAYVDVWLQKPGETGLSQVLVAGEDTQSLGIDASDAGTYLWQVDSYLNGAAHINEPNMTPGTLYIFDVIADFAPTVVIDTPDQMTWSGEGALLEATVTDDEVSDVTIEWTADAASLDDPNLVIDITNGGTETPTVTITKDADGLGLKTVTMTVSVTDAANPTSPDTDSVEIDVYDDACQMARQGEGKFFWTDLERDCVIDINDLAEFCLDWLMEYSSTGPADRQ